MIDLDRHREESVVRETAALALEGFGGAGGGSTETHPALAALVAAGSEIWLDTGDEGAIRPLHCREVTGLTTNNTLVNQVIQRGALDAALREASKRLRAAAPMPEDDLVLELGFVANARIALGLVAAFGAKVSVELHPVMADDIEASLLFARRYHALCPERFIIKAPLQPAGFLVVRRLEEEGIPVNYTLGFSARQNLLATRFSRPSYVNVFLGRLNAVVEENGIGDPMNIGEKATLASQEVVRDANAARGGRPTRQIAASVRNGEQVAALAGVDVLTIPPKALAEFLERPPASIESKRSPDLRVTLGDTRFREEAESLWEIPDSFRAFVEEAASADTSRWTGDDLASLARERGIRLFHKWAPGEDAVVRADGKIPKLEKWGHVPLDELMSRAALQSFAVDQQALDDRLRGLLAG